MRTRIPRYIDDPPQIFWWEIDEVALFSGAFVIGALSGQTLGGLLAGFVLSWLLERLKSGRGSAFLVHLAYWYGLSGVKPRELQREVLRVMLIRTFRERWLNLGPGKRPASLRRGGALRNGSASGLSHEKALPSARPCTSTCPNTCKRTSPSARRERLRSPTPSSGRSVSFPS